MNANHAAECVRLETRMTSHGEVREADFCHEDPTKNVDGGPRIERVAARMHDLKTKMHRNVISRREGRRAVYSLQAPYTAAAAPPLGRLHPSGYERRHGCKRCSGSFLDPADACHETEPTLEPPEQIVTGCLRIHKQEVRNAA